MKNLERILHLLKDVNFVTRPHEPVPELPPGEEEAMGTALPGQEMNPQDMPLSAPAIDNMLTSLDTQRQGDATPISEPEQALESPARKRLKYLDTMNQIQKNNYPELKSNPMLGGGKSGLRI